MNLPVEADPASVEAASVLKRHWGRDGQLRRLPGERDRNFRVTQADGESLVLKLCAASETRVVLEMQHRTLHRLSACDVAAPLPIASLDGAELVDLGHGRTGRLLSWLPGVPLAEVRPRTPALLESVGGLLGRFAAAMQGWAEPAARGRDLLWDPARSREVIGEHVEAVDDVARRALVDHFAALHDEVVAPAWQRLRRGVIHNDANDHNVLVTESDSARRIAAEWNSARRAHSLIDFGDMVEGPIVCELAVGAAYALLGQQPALAAAARVTAGFHAAFPLLDEEFEVLFPLMAMRLCVSVCLSARRRTTEPDNTYLRVSEAPAWQALERLAAIHPRLARATLREACGLTPLGDSGSLRRWLNGHAPTAAPILDGDALRGAVVLDLGIASLDEAAPEAGEATARWSERLFRRLSESAATVGIGRYAEARFMYASDAFAGGAGEHPERRSVHLGIDLFVKAGTPLECPLPGRIHSFRDNAQRLDYGPTIVVEHAPSDGPRFFTLYGHLTRDSLSGLAVGQEIAAGDVIARVGAPPENGDWPPHLHFQIVADMLDREGDFPGVASPGERAVWLALCPDPSTLLGLPAEATGPLARDATPAGARTTAERERLLAARQRLVGPSLRLSYRSPLLIVRGRGSWLYDDLARGYLDCVNNVAHVGHAHPRVGEAARRQSTVLNTNARYLHEHLLRYAERLTALLPAPLRVCYFVNSGSEANELALRLARTHTRRRGVVALEAAYHGNTSTLIDVSHYKFAGRGGQGPPDWVRAVPMPDDYRGSYRRDDPERGRRYAAYVADALGELDSVGGAAAFLCESLLSCGGQIPLPPGYLSAAYAAVRANGGVCVADEVQVGFGRVGSHVWGFELQDVVPDIVTLGKPIGNGHPLGAVVTTPEIAASFDNGMEFFATFGGNPVSCLVGLAVLDVIRDERLQEQAARVGGRLRQALSGLAERHLSIGDVRGEGLFVGVDLVRDRETREPAPELARYAVERAREHGVLLSTDGPADNVIKIKPPLVFEESDADRLVSVLHEVLAEDFVRSRVRGG